MKFKGIDGTPEEINNLFQNNGMNLADYIDKPEEPIKSLWLYISCISFVILLALLVYAPFVDLRDKSLVLLGSFCAGGWVLVVVQLKFKNGYATAVAAGCSLLVLLLASGVLQPSQIIETIKDLKN